METYIAPGDYPQFDKELKDYQPRDFKPGEYLSLSRVVGEDKMPVPRRVEIEV